VFASAKRGTSEKEKREKKLWGEGKNNFTSREYFEGCRRDLELKTE
jgi:hypothetical protein